MTLNLFYLRTIRLLSTILFLSSSVLTQAADTPNLQTRFQLFFHQASDLPYETRITLEQLNNYPASLLLSDSQYPNFEHYSWDDIQTLWQLHQTCRLSTKFTDLDSKQRPNLVRAIEFEKAICSNTALSDDWYSQGEMLHPAGGSYADHYLATLASDKQAQFIATHDRKLTLSNPSHPLHELLDNLPAKGYDLLLSGYRSYLAQDDKLWLNSKYGLVSIKGQAWRQLLGPLSIDIQLKSSDEQVCAMSYSNLCIQPPPPSNNGVQLLIAILSFLAASLFVIGLVNHREEAKERRFILQLLTHELRTPITSLGFTVEQFRKHFDQLDQHAQRSFGRLLADHQRLSQLAETSKGFLSADPDAQFQKQTAYLSDWLDHCLGKYNLNYELDNDQELTLPYYWLGICLDNLLRNALQHGKGEVSITISTNQNLRIEVMDQGRFPNQFHLLVKRLRLNTNHDNMGVGLTIVTRLMKKMRGRLIRYNNPTRYILELPL